jgi:5-methylcytosine-specific restriction enzyme subunit McrC
MANARSEKIKIKNIYYMLSYAYKTLNKDGVNSVSAEAFDNIHDLFAAILIHGVRNQIKRGLYGNYIGKEETIAGLRGQIKVGETLKQRTHTQGKLVCAFDEFSVDTPHNQALKSVMRLLLRHHNVKSENKDALRKLLLSLGDVSDVSPTAIRWDALNYHRNNASYVMLMGICRLVINGLLLTTESGTHKLSTWLQDDMMHHLYEKFVLAYYERHYPEFKPQPKQIGWDVAESEDSSYLPKMKTDITLQCGNRKLIIDTKYYSRTMHTSYDKKAFISSHLYQIFAYVQNSDRENTGNVAGVLLYAKTDEDITPDKDFKIKGNRISLKTLDLNQNWEAITEQLENLCTWLKLGICA